MLRQSDYWCSPNTPEDLKDALIGGDQDRLRQWCKTNPEQLELALEVIHPQHQVQRDIVGSALSSYQRDKVEKAQAQERRHDILRVG
jgi:hypothetical protein